MSKRTRIIILIDSNKNTCGNCGEIHANDGICDIFKEKLHYNKLGIDFLRSLKCLGAQKRFEKISNSNIWWNV